MENPWSVSSLNEFVYFCCPECDIRNKSEELFIEHALKAHPNSKDCMEKLIVKTEPIVDIFTNENLNLDETENFKIKQETEFHGNYDKANTANMEFSCYICADNFNSNIQFQTFKNLKSHLISVHKLDKGCQNCGLYVEINAFKDLELFQDHKCEDIKEIEFAIENGTEDFEINQEYVDYDLLHKNPKKHHKRKKEEPKLKECKICGKSMSSSNLKKHMKMVHEGLFLLLSVLT